MHAFFKESILKPIRMTSSGDCNITFLRFVGYLVCCKFCCTETDISATVQQIGVKVCMVVHIDPGRSPLWGRYPEGIPKILNFGRLKREYLENGKSQRCVLIRA